MKRLPPGAAGGWQVFILQQSSVSWQVAAGTAPGTAQPGGCRGERDQPPAAPRTALSPQHHPAVPSEANSPAALALCSLDLFHSLCSSQALSRLQMRAIFKSALGGFSLTGISACSASAPIIVCVKLEVDMN